MMSVKNLFYWSYWFSQPYIARGAVFQTWLWAFLIIFLVGLIAFIYSQKQSLTAQKKFYGRIASCFMTMGFLALLWLGLRQERIPFLAWRFWLLLWVVIFGAWLFKLIKYRLVRWPQILAEQKERAMKEKYIPGSK